MNMTKPNLQTIIPTKRLRLRPFCETDLEDVYAYASNPFVTEFLLWETHNSREDSRKFLEWAVDITSFETGSVFLVFAIELIEAGKVIGSIDFKNANPFTGQMDYVVAQDHWGKGIATEAVRALMEWAFSTFNDMVRLQIYCQPENAASRRVIEKSGLQYEGCLRKSFKVKEQIVDLNYYSAVRADTLNRDIVSQQPN